MEEVIYKTKGVCSTRIHLAINNGVLIKVRFESGCDGNLKAISRLVEGKPVTEVIKSLKGISCDGKSTSCPDQLARALEAMEEIN
jgi:uncharacterized protein (TIGR03905 family)